MKNNRNEINEKGLILTELIIALGLLGIVLFLGYNFLFSGMNIFNITETRSVVQREVRLVGDFITKEMRYATDIEIIDAADPANFTDTNYHYIYQDGTAIKHRSAGSSTGTSINNDTINMQIDFTKTAGSEIMSYTIDGDKAGESNYNIDSNVYLFNIDDIKGLNSHHAIRYKKPEY